MVQRPFTLACQDNLVPGSTLSERLTTLRGYGFDAVELSGTGLLERVSETHLALEDSGVEVAAICSGYRGAPLHPDPVQRRLALDDCKRLLDLAEAWAANGLIIAPDYGTPALPDLRPAVDPMLLLHDLFLAGLRELGEHLRGMRTALFIEPLNRYESRALLQVAPTVRLCEESDSANIKVLYDSFHMVIEEADPIGALRRAGAHLGHVHLADSNRQPPGYGHTDFVTLMSTLREMGFSGAAALECSIPGDPDVILPQCVAFLRQAYES